MRRKEGGGIGATDKKKEREREREKLGWCADVASAHLGGKNENEKTGST